jgi:hypothetical protein
MKLTAEQVSQINAFVAGQGIRFLDVQLEIIDHVASRVEELMTEDPQLTFTGAIAITNTEFGVKGFKGFEAGMISAMRKKYFRFFYTSFFSWFNWKYLPLIAALVYLLDRLYVTLNRPVLLVVGGGALLFTAITLNARSLSIKYKKNKKFYKRLLTMRIAGAYSGTLSGVYTVWIYFFVLDHEYGKANLNIAGIVFALAIVLVGLFFLTIKKMLLASLENWADLNDNYQLLKTN